MGRTIMGPKILIYDHFVLQSITSYLRLKCLLLCILGIMFASLERYSDMLKYDNIKMFYLLIISIL